MIRKSLFLFVLMFSFGIGAQKHYGNNNSILLRGKVSAFVIIEDSYFQNWNIGVEFRFAQHHSVGIDYVHFRWRYEYDIYVDDVEKGYGPDAFSRRRYLLLDYRYYPFRNLMREDGVDPYFNVFAKLGRRKIWTDDSTTFYSDNDVSAIRNQRADFTDYGAALGLRVDFGANDRFGLDANIGVVYRDTRILYEEQYDYDNLLFVERFDGNHTYWKPHMRLNLYVKLFNLK